MLEARRMFSSVVKKRVNLETNVKFFSLPI